MPHEAATPDGWLPTSSRNSLTLLVSIFGNSIDFVDASIVNVALPTIQLDLAGPLSAVQWLSSACLLALASLVVGGGVLSDRLGTITNP